MNYQFSKHQIDGETCFNQHCKQNECCDQKSTAAKIPLSSQVCPYSEFGTHHTTNSISCSSLAEDGQRGNLLVVVFKRPFSLNIESVEGFKESMKRVEDELERQKIFIIGLQIVVLSNLNKIEQGFSSYLQQLIEEYALLKISRICWSDQIYKEDNQIQR